MKKIFLILLALAIFVFLYPKKVVVFGGEYNYEIPSEFVRSKGWSVFGTKFSGDSAESIALRLDVGPKLGISKSEISIVMFLDREYDVYSDIYDFYRKIIFDLDSGLSTGEIKREYFYEKYIGSTRVKYYSSFDFKETEKIENASKDYFVSIMTQPPIRVGDREPVIPKDTCKIYMVFDFKLIQIGGVGHVCEPDVLNKLPAVIENFYKGWRV